MGLAESIQAIRLGKAPKFVCLSEPSQALKFPQLGWKQSQERFSQADSTASTRAERVLERETVLVLQGEEGKCTEACEWQIALNKETYLPSYQQPHQKLT